MSGETKPTLRYPIVVEGRYDRIKIGSLFDGCILTTEGFGIFREDEKLALIQRLAQEAGALIVLTDSDGAGQVIRNYFNSALPRQSLIHLYTPQVTGKEKRKTSPSKAGYLGVEGTDSEVLRTLLLPYCGENEAPARAPVSKADFYRDGFSGTEGSAARRDSLAAAADLLRGMSANALLEAINLLFGKEGYLTLLAQLDLPESAKKEESSTQS